MSEEQMPGVNIVAAEMERGNRQEVSSEYQDDWGYENYGDYLDYGWSDYMDTAGDED
jgi:hypothetical protein